MARRLIYVPVIHSQQDLGSAAERLTAAGKERLSEDGWKQHQQEVADFWAGLPAVLGEALARELADLGWEKLRIYQDGLPAGSEIARRIVDEVAEKGSPNYQLIKSLLSRGASIEKTESPDLLREEYRLIQRILIAPGPAERARAEQDYARRGGELLSGRDKFIARRIDQTLKQGEVGLLFVGASHQVRCYLPADIEVVIVSS